MKQSVKSVTPLSVGIVDSSVYGRHSLRSIYFLYGHSKISNTELLFVVLCRVAQSNIYYKNCSVLARSFLSSPTNSLETDKQTGIRVIKLTCVKSFVKAKVFSVIQSFAKLGVVSL